MGEEQKDSGSVDDRFKVMNNSSIEGAKITDPSSVRFKMEREVSRIRNVAGIYADLKSLLPEFQSEYLDAYEDIARRLDLVS